MGLLASLQDLTELVRMQIWGDLAFEPDRLFAWKLFNARKQAFLEHLGPAGLGDLPDNVTHTCCSQFAVNKLRIVQRGLGFFQGLQTYMASNNLTGFDRIHDKKYLIGDVFTPFWQQIFGEAPQFWLPPDCEIFDVPCTRRL